MKIVSGETRIGLREGLLEDAIARAFGREREEVGRAHMLTGDIGDTALRARHGTHGEPTLAHFSPIGVMLATPVLQLEEVGKRAEAIVGLIEAGVATLEGLLDHGAPHLLLGAALGDQRLERAEHQVEGLNCPSHTNA